MISGRMVRAIFGVFSGWVGVVGLGGMLTFAELVHSTHALVLRAHTLHATPMLTFAELVHPTHVLCFVLTHCMLRRC